MSWFHKLLPSSLRWSGGQKKDIPQGLWSRCPNCEKMLFNTELERQHKVCTHCDYHFPLSSHQRSQQLLSKVYSNLFENVEPCDPLKFKDTKKYKDRLKQSSASSSSSEAPRLPGGRPNLLLLPGLCFPPDSPNQHGKSE